MSPRPKREIMVIGGDRLLRIGSANLNNTLPWASDNE